jgi:group I intron endonuclease
MNKIIGIYKITNPKGAVYIGQSNNIERRIKDYMRCDCKGQRKLYHSLNKYGYESHTFEVIKECLESELNYYERYYQEYYNVLDMDLGLNLKYTALDGKSGKLSDETRSRISDGNKGKQTPKHWLGKNLSEDHKRKLSEVRKRNFESGKITSWNKGKTGVYTNETIKKMTKNLHTKEVRKKVADKKRGIKHSEGHKAKIRESCKGINSKKVINTESGVIYHSGKEAWDLNKYSLNILYTSFLQKLRGKRKNNTPFKYL